MSEKVKIATMGTVVYPHPDGEPWSKCCGDKKFKHNPADPDSTPGMAIHKGPCKKD